MDKRYQVFVSSTYSDLKEERGKVMQTIMALDCIPAGMELFPAIDEEQFEFIKKIIDDCDYYILIVGGRYGSISEDGISYTEKEYDYAVSKNIPVLAFLHNDIKNLTFEKSEANPEAREKLQSFRDKVSKGRLVQFWNNADELNGKVAVSLMKTIKIYPAVGWVRANLQSNTESLQEINDLRKKIEILEKEQKCVTLVNNLATLDELFSVNGDEYDTFQSEYGEDEYVKGQWSVSLSWRQIIILITPLFISGIIETYVNEKIGKLLYSHTHSEMQTFGLLSPECFTTIKIQLLAFGILDDKKIKSGIWKLSDKGYHMMLNERSVKTNN